MPPAFLRSLECNRQELMRPWGVTRPDPEDDEMRSNKKSAKMRSNKKITKSVDPPAKNSRERRKQSNAAASNTTPSRPDPIARAVKKLTTSRIHPQSTAASPDDASKSSKRVQPTKPPKENLYRRVQAESQKIVSETFAKRLSSSSGGLYEEFPTRKPSRKTSFTSEENHRSSLSCSATTIHRDEHGLFREEVDWKNTSVDWGD